MKEGFIQRSSISKHIDYFILKVILAFKENKEYKINLWSGLLINTLNLVITILFISIIVNNSLINLNWTKLDYIIFSTLVLLGSKGYHLFVFKHLSLKLRKGMLNESRIRPLNIIFIESLRSLRGPVLVVFPSLFILVIILIGLGTYTNYFFSIFFFIFSLVMFILYYDFLQSFAFFFKGLNLFQIFDSTNKLMSRFTPKAFDNFYPTLFYILPNSLLGFISVEILKDNFNYIIEFGFYIIIFFLFLLSSIITMWHYGLKKYEAFG